MVGLNITGGVGVNVAPSERQPFNSQQAIRADAPGTIDKVGHELATVLTGDFSASTGSNPVFGWGLNVFTTTGRAAGDANGAVIQNLIESDVEAPSGTIAVVQGLVAQAAFFGASAGATVGQMESLRVAAPARKDGATAGTAERVYGLLVEAVIPDAVGATKGAFSVLVDGGVSRFGGRVDVSDSIANAGRGDLTIRAGFSNSDGASLTLAKAAHGGGFRVSGPSGNVLAADTTGLTLAGGGRIYVAADGALHYRSPAGTDTQLAA